MKKYKVHIIGLVSILLNYSQIFAQENSFVGTWESVNNDSVAYFDIELITKNDSILGKHCSVINCEKTIDCATKDDWTLKGILKGDSLVVSFTSAYSLTIGEAVIKLDNENEILWRITKAPKGIYYLPKVSVLKRSSGTRE